MARDFHGVQVPEAADIPAPPRGIVLHWTAGGHKANSVDLGAYHYVVEGDGAVRRGAHPVAANLKQLRAGDSYAAHTGGFNSFRIGLSAAGMSQYAGPGKVGPFPLTKVQVERLCELAAYFCDLGGLSPLDPWHLCTHREVWTIHQVRGTRNDQKRDIDHLPFMPALGPNEVGPYLRKLTARYLTAAPEPEDAPVVGTRLYSPSLGWITVATYDGDTDWTFVRQNDLEAVLRAAISTRAGTPLSKMPREP
jgi:hypothetical protein